MSREVPIDRPLSDEDRTYLHARGEHAKVDYIDSLHPAGEAAPSEEEGGDDYDSWKADELRAELARRGLAKSGNVAELITRLREDDAGEA